MVEKRQKAIKRFYRKVASAGINRHGTNVYYNRKQIKTNNRRYQALMNQSEDVFMILSSDGTMEYISASSEKVTGYTPEERVGRKINEFYSSDLLKKVSRMMDLVLSKPNKKIRDEVRYNTRIGDEIYLEVNIKNLLHDPSIQGIMVHFRDISQRMKTEQKVKHMFTHDELTGLPNRVYLKQMMDLSGQRQDVETVVFMIDVDRFKYINNVLGYTIGDRLILQIARRLQSYVDDSSTLCRYSTDRFIIVSDIKKSNKDIETYAKEITALFKETFLVENYELDVTVCLGISECKDDPDSRIKNAESALYWAKREGVNKYKIFSKEVAMQDYRQFELRNDLRKALEKNQLRVHYQPLVCLQTNEVYAIEALMRWDHPILGMILPKEFISLAEETGLIINMGNWLLRQVCMDYKKWLSEGYSEIMVSVNYSSVQFYESNFVQNIKNTIEEFELKPDFLIMEITESILMNKNEKTLQNLRALKALGIKLALDDFGTGYSSFGYLHVIKTDIIKLDKSFTKKIAYDETGRVIIKTIIDMAKELGIKLVAEGIEDFDQLKSLIEMNCYVGQGYLYSEPVPFDEIMSLLAHGICEPGYSDYSASAPSERRKSFRVKFDRMVVSDLTVYRINDGEKIKIRNSNVLIRNIGPGGLCFLSDTEFRSNQEALLQFKTVLLGQEVIICGYPLWTEKISKNLYECGVYFTMDESNTPNLTELLDQLFEQNKDA